MTTNPCGFTEYSPLLGYAHQTMVVYCYENRILCSSGTSRGLLSYHARLEEGTTLLLGPRIIAIIKCWVSRNEHCNPLEVLDRESYYSVPQLAASDFSDSPAP